MKKYWFPKSPNVNVKLTLSKAVNEISAWGTIAYAIQPLVDEFKLKADRAIEFGCEYGYSTAVLANTFKSVVAVDLFTGDKHSGRRQNFKSETAKALSDFNNITLIQGDCLKHVVAMDEYDFAHVDIVHDYQPTYDAGDMLLNAGVPCVVFHDTISFPEVLKAVTDLAKKHDCNFYEFPYSHGLGILMKK